MSLRRPTARCVILSITLFLPTFAISAVQTITATHTYVMGDNDSKNDARRMCFLEAKRKVLEKAGTLIESSSEVKNFQLSKDKISSYTAAVLRVEATNEEFTSIAGQTSVTMTVKADVDTTDIHKRLSAIIADKGLQEKIAIQQKQLKQLEDQVRVLSQKLDMVPASASKSPSLNEFLAGFRAANPNFIVSDEELTEYWTTTYGLRRERNQVLGNIQVLENKAIAAKKRITGKTDLITKYIVKNMTVREVISILGQPVVNDDFANFKLYNYGEKWICFTDGLVSGIGNEKFCNPNLLPGN